MQSIVDNLRQLRHRDSTRNNYYGIWKNFNNFFIRLDIKPNNWEDRIVLYVAYLIHGNRKSTTIKSYISAIKAVLFNGGIEINEDSTLLAALTRACKLHKDIIRPKLIIKGTMVELMIRESDKKFSDQPYLAIMYRALLATMYYGMFRIGELTLSDHVVKARDVHIGTNKPKLLFVLHSSKTHGKGQKPQLIKISASNYLQKHLCPFKLLSDYISLRSKYRNLQEQFFVFSDRSPVKPTQYR